MSRESLWMVLSLPVVLLVVVAGHYGFDLPVTAFTTNLPPRVVDFFQVITHLGKSTGYLIGIGLLFLYFFYGAKNRARAFQMFYLFSAVALSGLLTDVVKWFMGRWRPKVFLPEGLYGYEFFGSGYEQTSFPSGHATTICSLAFALSVLFPRLRWLWIILAFLVCVSRVVIGAHYLSDVLMGAYIGIFVTFLLRKWPPFSKSIKKGVTA